MNTVKKAVLGMYFLLLAASLAFAETGDFKPGSEPTGFRGKVWGTHISNFSDLIEWETIGEDKSYYKEYENLNVFDCRAEGILYIFDGDRKFLGVLIWFIDQGRNFETLKERLFATYGVGQDHVGDYMWWGECCVALYKKKDLGTAYVALEISTKPRYWGFLDIF